MWTIYLNSSFDESDSNTKKSLKQAEIGPATFKKTH
jgi:hypothetical protein